MERESFLFYRSFYEAIKLMPSEVQAEIYTLIMEYALYGKQPGKNISDIAKGVFALIKPNIDVNTARFENGKKGGRKTRVKSSKKQVDPYYNLTYEQEVEQMKADSDWTASVCEDFKISSEEYADRLQRFLKHCNENRNGKPHDSFDDAKSHLRYWMSKAYPQTQQPSAPAPPDDEPSFPDYTFHGGFGGMDS